MYKRTMIKFLIALGTACAAFSLICCVIAFVRLFQANRQLRDSQETWIEQNEELEQIRKTVKKAARQEKKAAHREKTPTETPDASPTPTVSANESVKAESTIPPLAPSVSPSASQETAAPRRASVGGHTIGIDPGHQGPHVDMSATEPNGPNSAEMKAKATSGTSGVYSGLGEYQLNLDVSLKLQQILEKRGYQVVMCRTDNDTPISNAERALLAADGGAEIYVRIHANGSDDHNVQGALSMSPSPDNPYVPHLYEDSMRLSQTLLDSYCAATGFENRGVQLTDTMTGINWSQVPVTILEMGFMSNEHDDLAMADSSFQQTMAEGIADGIDAYFEQ